MDEERVKKILKPEVLSNDGGLYSLGWYLAWSPNDTEVTLDGPFTADELEAIAWWMKNKSVRQIKKQS